MEGDDKVGVNYQRKLTKSLDQQQQSTKSAESTKGEVTTRIKKIKLPPNTLEIIE